MSAPRFSDGTLMRILMAGTFTFPQGAASRAVHMQAKGLAEAGHDVVVVVCLGSTRQKYARLDGFTVRSFDSTEEGRCGLPGQFRWLKAQLGMLLYLLASVLGRRFDCIMFYGVAPIFAFVVPIARLLRQRTCLIQYDLMETDVFLGFWNYLYRKLIVGSEKFLARYVSLIIIGYSSALEDIFQYIAPETPRIKVWPPTDTTYFASGDGARARSRWGLSECRLVVYAGSISRLEGSDVLLRAVPEVKHQCPDMKLVIAGPVTQFDPVCGQPLDYELLAQELGIDNAVLFAGVLPTDQFVDLLAAADCLVMPKVDHPANAAASPIKMGEYLASGRPVVASRVCELDKWLRHGEDIWFCEPGNVRDLAHAIVQMLVVSELAKEIGRSGQQAAREVCDYRAWARRVGSALQVDNGRHGIPSDDAVL